MSQANRGGRKIASRVEFVDSRESVGIQLADMIAGATRVFAESEGEDSEFFDTFKHRTTPPRGILWRLK